MQPQQYQLNVVLHGTWGIENNQDGIRFVTVEEHHHTIKAGDAVDPKIDLRERKVYRLEGVTKGPRRSLRQNIILPSTLKLTALWNQTVKSMRWRQRLRSSSISPTRKRSTRFGEHRPTDAYSSSMISLGLHLRSPTYKFWSMTSKT